ncbi:MAG: hypothetical protein QM771_00595 [Nitrospira sp.]
MPGLMELLATVSSRQEHFTETKTLAMLTQPVVLKGTLAYVRPDRVEKHVTSPIPRTSRQGRPADAFNPQGHEADCRR